MGVILSCIALASNTIKKRQNQTRTESQSSPSSQDPHAPAPAPPQPYAPPASTDLEDGLLNEHLATVPPSVPVPVPVAAAAAADSTPPQKEESTSTKMASDEDYASFLDKANQDPNEGSKTQSAGKQSSGGKIELKAVDKGVSVPAALKKVAGDAFYTSDADEPFEAVALTHTGKSLPDEETFAKLVGHPDVSAAGVEIMDIGEWDPQGQYKEVVDATREVTKGSDVRVYRISRGGSRVEYWVVGLEGGKLLGLKALAIES